MSSRTCAALGTALALAFFCGCADDGPAYRPITPHVASRPRPITPASALPTISSSAQTAGVQDALESPDALAGDSLAAPAADSVPLTPGTTDAPALKYDDALDRTPDTLAGQTPGNKMPTEHSHWLKGRIFNARVTVRLNGMFLGTYSAPQDRDITMKLRSGMNTVALTYQPLTSTASAQLDILESEHDPPIPPLATFRSPDLAMGQTAGQTITQTLTFLAR